MQGKAKKIVVIGGGYIGMEVAAAACGWNLDTTVRMIFHLSF
jgi:monodehydroascorbate reductase (NADH)